MTATMSGVYRFRVRASGLTLRQMPFTREQIVTGAVWRGGDKALPTTTPPDEMVELICDLLRCLFGEKGVADGLWRRLDTAGVDGDHLRRCIELICPL